MGTSGGTEAGFTGTTIKVGSFLSFLPEPEPPTDFSYLCVETYFLAFCIDYLKASSQSVLCPHVFSQPVTFLLLLPKRVVFNLVTHYSHLGKQISSTNCNVFHISRKCISTSKTSVVLKCAC